MTPEKWARLQRLFQEALRRCPADRAPWLADATEGDAALLTHVTALLDCDAAPDGAIERAIAEAAAGVLAQHDPQGIVRRRVRR